MIPRLESTDPEDLFFVDSGITYDGAPATTITGITHLLGKTVHVMADGVDIPDKVVSVTGEITLDVAASVVHVGLPYTCDLKTLKPDLNTNEGTIQGRKVRCSHVVVKFLESRGGKLGPNENNLYDVDLKRLSTLEDPLALVSGDVKHTVAGDWDGGQIFFRQDRPLPTTILSIVPVLTVGG